MYSKGRQNEMMGCKWDSVVFMKLGFMEGRNIEKRLVI